MKNNNNVWNVIRDWIRLDNSYNLWGLNNIKINNSYNLWEVNNIKIDSLLWCMSNYW
jgi:hypothetical protein